MSIFSDDDDDYDDDDDDDSHSDDILGSYSKTHQNLTLNTGALWSRSDLKPETSEVIIHEQLSRSWSRSIMAVV